MVHESRAQTVEQVLHHLLLLRGAGVVSFVESQLLEDHVYPVEVAYQFSVGRSILEQNG